MKFATQISPLLNIFNNDALSHLFQFSFIPSSRREMIKILRFNVSNFFIKIMKHQNNYFIFYFFIFCLFLCLPPSSSWGLLPWGLLSCVRTNSLAYVSHTSEGARTVRDLRPTFTSNFIHEFKFGINNEFTLQDVLVYKAGAFTYFFRT